MYIPIILMLMAFMEVKSYQFEGFGIVPSQSEADQLIRKANAGLWSLRLKMKLLGDPSFLVGSPHMYELETYFSRLQLANDSRIRSVESDNQNAVLQIDQYNDNSDVMSWNWVSYLGTVGPHRAVCMTTKDINPNVVWWHTGTSTCVVLRIDQQYCNGNAYLLPKVGKSAGTNFEVWAPQESPSGSVLIYCH